MFTPYRLPTIVPGKVLWGASNQAYNDPVSNIVILGDEHSDEPEMTIEALATGGFLPACLPAFLHEGTHHRCFDSPLGHVMQGIESVIRLQSHRAFACARSSPDDAHNEVCQSRTLLRQVLWMLTPLAEGLALYGELEAVPGDSVAASAMALNAASVFGWRLIREALVDSLVRGGPDPGLAPYSDWLKSERKTNTAFGQTRRVLDAGDDNARLRPYRVGFRWVSRRAERLLAHSTSHDSDVVLAFLCSYFFDDLHLASLVAQAVLAILGRSGASLDNSVEGMARYLRERLAVLEGPTAASMLVEYESRLAQGSVRGCSFLNDSPAARGEVEMVANFTGAHELYVHAPKNQRARHSLRFGVLFADNMDLQPKQQRIGITVGGKTFDVRLLMAGLPYGHRGEPIRAGRGEASIEFILSHYNTVVLFFYGGSLVGATDRELRSLPDDEVEDEFGQTPSVLHAEAERSYFWNMLTPDSEVRCGRFMTDATAAAEEHVRSFYSR